MCSWSGRSSIYNSASLDGEVHYHFTCYGGMCSYKFDKFFKEAENKFDFQVQVNALHFLTTLIDEGILGLPVR